MSNDRENEPFLSRWSRQKQQQAKALEVKPQVAGTPDAPEPEIDLSKLTKLEDLTAESDLTQFLQKGVPEALQKLALRKMWSLDPAIRDFVEVAENQWDFNMPGGIYGLYEDLAEGTDVSVWMAQATQSVVGGEAKKPTVVGGGPMRQDDPDAPAVATVEVKPAAVQQNASDDELRDAAVAAEPGAPVGVGRLAVQQLEKPSSNQAPDVVLPANKRSDTAPPEPTPVRRRHGGALPA